jgi:hypothetical protein
MPGSAFPPLGRLGLTSPVSLVLCLTATANRPSWVASLFAFASQYLVSKETIGSLEFLSYPFERMPRSQTPVVSLKTRLSDLDAAYPFLSVSSESASLASSYLTFPGLLPSSNCTLSAFTDYSFFFRLLLPLLYPFRGSIARPASLFHPAPYSCYQVCTWISLLTCSLGFYQVGLSPTG